MTVTIPDIRITRRKNLAMVLAALAAGLPTIGSFPVLVRAEDDGGDGGGEGGGDGGGEGGGDGGGDDGGGDGGGDDSGGDDGGSEDGGATGGSPGVGGKPARTTRAPAARDGTLAERLKGRVAPVTEIESLALHTKPGEIIDIQLYRSWGLYIYRVAVMQANGTIYDLKFDAITRKLLNVRRR